MHIGSVNIKGRAVLAPLAGTADRAFRELCRSYGAAYTVGEMASAKGISLNDRKSKTLLTLTDAERPAGVQLFGDSPVVIHAAVLKALEFAPDFIDINMGCPAPKVVSGGGGARLMCSPELAQSITLAAVSASTVPVTVKLRAGWDESCINAVELAVLCEQAGAAAITVHGRTRAQQYAPPVNTDIIKAVKQAVKIPVIGNGDVTDGYSAAKMLEQTGCDAVMIGRGALGRPWVFAQVNAYLEHEALLPEPPVTQRMLVMLTHAQKLCEYKGEHIGILETRKHAAWYTKGLPGAAKYRSALTQLTNLDELKEVAAQIINDNT